MELPFYFDRNLKMKIKNLKSSIFFPGQKPLKKISRIASECDDGWMKSKRSVSARKARARLVKSILADNKSVIISGLTILMKLNEQKQLMGELGEEELTLMTNR